jgi:hypothetical protein
VYPAAVLRFHHLDGITLQEVGMVRDIVMGGVVSQDDPEIIGFLIVVWQVDGIPELCLQRGTA